jgi:hypothetical protein
VVEMRRKGCVNQFSRVIAPDRRRSPVSWKIGTARIGKKRRALKLNELHATCWRCRRRGRKKRQEKSRTVKLRRKKTPVTR